MRFLGGISSRERREILQIIEGYAQLLESNKTSTNSAIENVHIQKLTLFEESQHELRAISLRTILDSNAGKAIPHILREIHLLASERLNSERSEALLELFEMLGDHYRKTLVIP